MIYFFSAKETIPFWLQTTAIHDTREVKAEPKKRSSRISTLPQIKPIEPAQEKVTSVLPKAILPENDPLVERVMQLVRRGCQWSMSPGNSYSKKKKFLQIVKYMNLK